jgi:uncharacterized protein DUF6602
MTYEWDGPEPEPVQAGWFRALGREIKESYDKLHHDALSDIQRAGHGGESAWVRVLKSWLPPSYEVVTRKYIIPEIGDDSFETDIVILNPSYPRPLREREEILPGGVAAAFSVKLTLNAEGIRDGIDRAVRLRRILRPRIGAPRHEMLAPFPVGLLAHSHTWTRPTSKPRNIISEHLQRFDKELAMHPRESLDYLCVSDLAMWSVNRMPYFPGSSPMVDSQAETEEQRTEGAAFTSIQQTDPDQNFNAVASLITHLLVRLSYFDSTLRPIADNMVITGSLGRDRGPMRIWTLSDVFTPDTRSKLPHRAFQEPNSDWAGFIF